MNLYYPPQRPSYSETKDNFSIFLAGTIDQGISKDWQQEVTMFLQNYRVNIFNPRRPSWDRNVKQTITDPVFSEQVNWELDQLEKVDLIVMYLLSNSMSPISLLEFGMFSKSNMIVFCASDFYRRGNIEIVCHRNKIPLFSDEKEFYNKLKSALILYDND